MTVAESRGPMGPPMKRKRRAGPFKRSRTGCGTCKRRGKKCDEAWNADGFCQRCLAGQWDCDGRSEIPSDKRLETAQSSTPTPSPTNAPSTPVVQMDTSPLQADTTQSQICDFQTEPPGAFALPHTTIQPAPIGPSQNPMAWALDTPSSAGATLTSLPVLAPPIYNWPTHTQTTPSAIFTNGSDTSFGLDSWNTGGDGSAKAFWEELERLFPLNAQPNDELNAGLNGNSRVLFLSVDRPMRQGVSLAEIYARVVESWLVGLPSTARDYARARITALHDNNSVMRAVRYAVATAYIFLFASNPEDAKEPQPKLVELAHRGAGVHEGVKNRSASESPANKDDLGAEDAIQRLRLYVNHVSTPYAADQESRKWTEDAIQELRHVVVTDKMALSDLLWGVIDLQLVEFIRGGAAPSYNMLALGDRLIMSVFKEPHPTLKLAELRTSNTFSLRLYALSDISRCIVHRGRRTIFNVGIDPGTPDVPTIDQNEEYCWSAYLGLPDGIVVILAQIVNLCADMATTPYGAIKEQADQVETAIRNWKFSAAQSTDTLDASAVVSRTIAGQLWRLSAYVLLYQSIHRVGALHPVLRQARAEMLSLLDSVIRLPNGDLWGFIALPAFLAATLSLDESDRRRAMKHMKRPGPERMWLDNIALVEKVWQEVDISGKPVDWHDKMQREGLSVAFF